jgi:RNA polymerase sigma-70 factor (ECF subfamily)
MLKPADDDALVARASDGDAAAFRDLYEQFAPLIYRFALFRVRNASDAEDITQRVFIKVIEALPRYERRGLPFGAWLFRIARNSVIDFERVKRPRDPLDVLEFQASEGPGPAELAEADLERQALVQGISELTREQQEVIAYRFFGGLSPREIADVMGKREGSIRALQFRAIESLRATLGPVLRIEPLPDGADPETSS